MTVKTDSDIRDQVKEAYVEALSRAKSRTGGCCSSDTPPAGAAAKLVNYGDDTTDLPEEAVASSFGCGNPLAFAGVEEGQVVLDLGSGAGLDLLIASRKVGATGKVIGVDMTDEMLAAARKNATDAGADNVDLRKGVIEEMPVEDSSVDWVISNCVINLSPQKEKVFAEIARVLKPGGQFSISDIVAQDLPAKVRELAVTYSACIGGAIAEPEYRGGLEKAGLTDIQVTDRFVYSADALSDMVASDFVSLGAEADEIRTAIHEAAGKVASVRISGKKAPRT
jgi:arsenite methyltransferase